MTRRAAASRGRPPMGSGPAEVVRVRLDPDLKLAVERRAELDHMTTSEIIREAQPARNLRQPAPSPKRGFSDTSEIEEANADHCRDERHHRRFIRVAGSRPMGRAVLDQRAASASTARPENLSFSA